MMTPTRDPQKMFRDTGLLLMAYGNLALNTVLLVMSSTTISAKILNNPEHYSVFVSVFYFLCVILST